MIFETILKRNAVMFSIITVSFLVGCTTTTKLVKKEHVKIERVNSSSVDISNAYLQSTDTTLLLLGEVKSRFPGRGAILGHIHIELIGPDNNTFKEATTGYKRKSIKSRFATFTLPVPYDLKTISSIRITHHDLRSHQDDSMKSPWRDPS